MMASANVLLCEACRKIDFAQPYHEPKHERLGADDASRVFYAHHPSLKALELSARPGGCRLCKLLYSSIRDFNRIQHEEDHVDQMFDELLAEEEPEPQADKAHAGVFRLATQPGSDLLDVSAPVILILEAVFKTPHVYDPPEPVHGT